MAGDVAILLGHIPPGPSHFELDSICARGHYYQRAGGACWDTHAQRTLARLLAHFSDVVPASYFGHHHTASVRVLRDDETDHAQHDASSRAVAASADYEGDPGTDADADIGSASTASAPAASASARHVMYLSPSLTPRNPMHDPTVRLYRYNRRTGTPIDFVDYSFNVTRANAAFERGRSGVPAWTEQSALRTAALNLSSLSPAAWHHALSRMLRYDHHPRSDRELSADDPFLKWVSAERCALEAYVDSGSPQVPHLRKCKLAHLCAALQLADRQYARCIGQPLSSGGGE